MMPLVDSGWSRPRTGRARWLRLRPPSPRSTRSRAGPTLTHGRWLSRRASPADDDPAATVPTHFGMLLGRRAGRQTRQAGRSAAAQGSTALTCPASPCREPPVVRDPGDESKKLELEVDIVASDRPSLWSNRRLNPRGACVEVGKSPIHNRLAPYGGPDSVGAHSVCYDAYRGHDE